MSEAPAQFEAFVQIIHTNPNFNRYTTSLAGPMVPADGLWRGSMLRDFYDQLVAAGLLAPDPDALNLSTAMRMARERSEAGQETWVCLHEWDVPACLRFEKRVFSPHWQYADQLVDGKPLWLEPGRFSLDFVAAVNCQLVTPDEGKRLLRGER